MPLSAPVQQSKIISQYESLTTTCEQNHKQLFLRNRTVVWNQEEDWI